MARYRFAVEYLGTAFAGWQIQPRQATVEGELEQALATALRRPVDIVGAGRTDAGVHARGQVAHFDCDLPVDVRKLERSVNALTSAQVFIRRLEACAPEFHARFHALSRLYHYRIALRPSALWRDISWDCGYDLDVEKLRGELRDVAGIHNFANFSVPRDDGKSTECEVYRAEVHEDPAFLTVHLEANRFLHKMVRAIVGAAFEVARGAEPAGLVRAILAGGHDREWTWAPAQGLCLERVKYKDYDF